MQKNFVVLALVIAVLVMLATGASPQKPQPQGGVLAPLKVGQSVTLHDRGDSYEIRFTDSEVKMAYTVVEVGHDYVVLRDFAEVTEIRIPIFAIKALVRLKTKT